MVDLTALPTIPVPVIAALIAAVAALVGYRTYSNKTNRDARDDIVKAESLVAAIEISLVEKAKRAQRGLPRSGLTTTESESMTRTLDEALTIAPHSAKVYEVAAAFNNAIGNLAKAETYYRRAASLAPSDPNKHLALFIHLQRIDGSNSDQHLSKALEKAANSPDAFVGIGMALVILGRLDEAEFAYRTGLEIDPNISALWYNLGILLRRKVRHDDSYAAFAKAAAINPNDPEIFCNLGNACHRVGKHEDALGHLRTAIRLDPNYALPHNSLATILQHLGQEDEAQAAHRRFLELRQAEK